MSWQIEIHRAKPNPVGKDRSQHGVSDEQLLAEWVDLKNVGDTGVQLSILNLANLEFEAGCRAKSAPVIYWTGPSNGVLLPGQIVRVHTGKSSAAWRMRQEDQAGVQLHAYAEKGNFVLNNKCGDVLSVWWKGSDQKWNKDDEAEYDPNPPDGAVLVRRSTKLIPATTAAYSYR